jgi:hypothetical protein
MARNMHVGYVALLFPILALVGALPLAAQVTNGVADTETRVHSPHPNSGFGKSESITGTLTRVNPQEGMVIVTRRGPGEPASTQLSGTETKAPNSNEVIKTNSVKATPAPGETEYRFRVTTHSLIKASGQRVTLADLTQFQNKPATVYFVPERSGNFVLGLDVSE